MHGWDMLGYAQIIISSLERVWRLYFLWKYVMDSDYTCVSYVAFKVISERWKVQIQSVEVHLL